MLKSVYKYAILPYTLVMLYFMFFGMGRSQYEHNIVRIVPIYSTIEYIEQAFSWKEDVAIVLGNLIMFIPYGFLGWVLPKCKNIKYLIINFVSAITIVEALQYFTRLGVFDIDDIMINTIGVYFGYQLCKVFETRFSRLVL